MILERPAAPLWRVVLILALALSVGLSAAATEELALDAAPGFASPEDVIRTWETASRLERTAFSGEDPPADVLIDRLSRAAILFEGVAEKEDSARGYWRASRATWLSGELLPLDQEAAKIVRFERALELSDLGLARDDECAECMLWKFIAMGRLRTTQGLWEGARQVKDMAVLLDRAIALNPTYRDSDDNSTLGNLHYSSAIFYRLVPDWFWIKWVLGVKGDKKRALEHSRKALALHPTRLDYQVEVGTQLLCLGTDRGDADRVEEGKAIMRAAIGRGADNEDARRELHFAQLMLDEPARSCGYSGDQLLEVDEDSMKKSARE